MPYLIGTDEAGYGPNLGPLVVSATVWRVKSLADTDLFHQLRNSVRRSLDNDQNGSAILIGDSKDLYKPGRGLAGLEQGVLTCLATLEKCPRTWKEIWEVLATASLPTLIELPWYRNFDRGLPIDLPSCDLAARAQRFLVDCRAVDCEPTHIESRAVFPKQFNQLIEQYGNKASALSQITLELVRTAVDRLPREPVYVVCDKHGGRNKYGRLLHSVFPHTLAMATYEGRQESSYRLHHDDRRCELVFRAKGETFLPSALASMVSKYLRELAMLAFNTFWQSHISNLKPTAGYPTDAKRFKLCITPTQQKLGINDTLLWRSR